MTTSTQPASQSHDNTLRGYWQFVRIICFSLIVPLGVSAAFAVVPQGIEMLRVLVEPAYGDESKIPAGSLVLFLIASIGLAHFARFWASNLLHYEYPAYPRQLLPDEDGIRHARIWLPRTCAFLAYIGIAIGFMRAAVSPGGDKARLWIGSAVFLALALGQVLYGAYKHRAAKKQAAAGARIVFHRFHWGFSGDSRALTFTRWYAAAALLATLVFIFMFAFGWDGIGRWFGSAPLLCLAGCAWVSLGSFFRLLGLHYRIPFITAALIAALVFSMFMDNHTVHFTTNAVPENRPSLRERYRAWHTAIQEKHPLPAGTPRPLFIVAAEGGGIRAAFWTAKVLCTLQQLSTTERTSGEKSVEFAPHVFAISGVSGGSLGAAVFTAMCADGSASNVEFAENMLSRDHLAPLMAKMFFPDTLQRFLPFTFPGADRARGLERSWELCWREEVNKDNDRFADPFHTLWSGADGAPLLPNLFLNSTAVETGQRIIASNVPIRNDAGSRFLDCADAAALIAGGDLSLSSAVHLSARFTYFSPAGRMNNDRRAVDGGYFENSGCVTAIEILRVVTDEIASARTQEKIIPVLILISNEPGAPDVARQAEAALKSQMLAALPTFVFPAAPLATSAVAQNPAIVTAEAMLKAVPDSFASETLAPVRALLRTRESRGNLAKTAAFYEFSPLPQLASAQTAVQRAAATGPDYPLLPTLGDLRSRFVHFRLHESETQLPLGWALSKPACNEMNRQLWAWDLDEAEAWSGDPGRRPAAFNAARLSGVMQMLTNTEAAQLPFSKENRELFRSEKPQLKAASTAMK